MIYIYDQYHLGHKLRGIIAEFMKNGENRNQVLGAQNGENSNQVLGAQNGENHNQE